MAKIIWQARVFEGGPLFAASTATRVTVIDKSDDTLASLWSDRDGLSIKSNPFFITVAGKIEMYLDPGRYRITAAKAGQTDTWEDVLIIDPDAGGGGTLIPWPGRSESSTSITLDSDDLQQLIETTGASPVITIPTEASDDLGGGFVCYGIHHGGGEVTFDDSDVTLIHPFGLSPSVPTLSPWTLVKSRTASNTWYLFGGLEQAS